MTEDGDGDVDGTPIPIPIPDDTWSTDDLIEIVSLIQHHALETECEPEALREPLSAARRLLEERADLASEGVSGLALIQMPSARWSTLDLREYIRITAPALEDGGGPYTASLVAPLREARRLLAVRAAQRLATGGWRLKARQD